MSQLQQLEEERLRELHKYLSLYKHALDTVPPQMTTVSIHHMSGCTAANILIILLPIGLYVCCLLTSHLIT